MQASLSLVGIYSWAINITKYPPNHALLSHVFCRPQDAPKEFYVSFFNLPLVERVRQLKTNRIGRLVSVSGTVTRSTDVRPELLRGTFTCRKCGLVRTRKQAFPVFFVAYQVLPRGTPLYATFRQPRDMTTFCVSAVLYWCAYTHNRVFYGDALYTRGAESTRWQ